MEMSKAVWIDPKGNIIDSGGYHIALVLKHPEIFGYTKDKLQRIYDKHGEKMSPWVEGNARNDIITALVKKGWIHIRKRLNWYNVFINNKKRGTKDNLWIWANKEIKNTGNKYMDVKITSVDGKLRKSTLYDLSSGKLIEYKGSINCDDVVIYNENNIDMYYRKMNLVYKYLK